MLILGLLIGYTLYLILDLWFPSLCPNCHEKNNTIEWETACNRTYKEGWQTGYNDGLRDKIS